MDPWALAAERRFCAPARYETETRMPSETPRDYRRRAAECEKLAAEAQDPRIRETMLYVASRWIAMAEADEKHPPLLAAAKSSSAPV